MYSSLLVKLDAAGGCWHSCEGPRTPRLHAAVAGASGEAADDVILLQQTQLVVRVCGCSSCMPEAQAAGASPKGLTHDHTQVFCADTVGEALLVP
jgi:hypothetical protein